MITTAGTGLSVFGAVMAIVGAILDFAVTTTTSGFNVNTAGFILLVAGAVLFFLGVIVLTVHLATGPTRETRTVPSSTIVEEDHPVAGAVVRQPGEWR
jgi:hypothetical protein